jgi:glycolate oxidase FAD binding subunit
VSGFDLCRLLVGSRGTLGLLGAVLLRTRPLPTCSQWFATTSADPVELLRSIHRPVSILWDGTTTWVRLDGAPADVERDAVEHRLDPVEGPPPLPTGGRWSLPPAEVPSLAGTSGFVAEVGVGIVHHTQPAPPRPVDPAVAALHRRIKQRFDPEGRLNPGLDVLGAG